MQLVSLSTLSALAIVSASLCSVSARPALHNADIVPRAHRAIAREAVAVAVPAAKNSNALARSPVTVPRTLHSKKKRSTKQKRCRIRPSSNSTTVSSTPDVTGTVEGDYHHHHSTSIGSPSGTGSAVPSPSATGSYNSDWHLASMHQGENFFDGWTFWTSGDPTHGTVQFVQDNSLAYIQDGIAYMRASTADYPANGLRESIRIHETNYTYTNGLVLMDSKHMPVGCGTWPAFWTNGPNWPDGGEIDIVEGVHNDQENHGTLHTSDGCYTSTDNVPTPSGQQGSTACVGNQGCGYTDTTSNNNYGTSFNLNDGGVYAMRLDETGISMWFFPRNAIPDDVTAGTPVPETWPAPYASWSSSTCSTSQFFAAQTTIFDLTFCGDWAGAVWDQSGCRESTGKNSCEEYVGGLGSNFQEAYWAVNYVKYFAKN